MNMKFKLFARLKKKADDSKKSTASFDNLQEPVGSIELDEGQESSSVPQGADENLQREISDRLSKGMSEGEVIKSLKEKGYGFDQIDSAMTGILKEKTMQAVNTQAPQQQNALYSSQDPLLVDHPNNMNYPASQPGMDNLPPLPTEGLNIEEVEEIVNEMLYAKLNEIYEFKEKTVKSLEETNKKVNAIESAVNEIKKNFEMFRKNNEKESLNLKEKISDLVPRVKSVENAFKDVIPNIVDEQRAIKAEFDSLEEKAGKVKNK